MLEHGISCKVLKIITQEYSNNDLGLTVRFFGNVKFAIWAFIWEEFIDCIEDFGAKVNIYS